MLSWLLRRAFNRQVRRGFVNRQHGWNDPNELLRYYAAGIVDSNYVGRILAKGTKWPP